MVCLSIFGVLSLLLVMSHAEDCQNLANTCGSEAREAPSMIDLFGEVVLTFGTLLATFSILSTWKRCCADDARKVQTRKLSVLAFFPDHAKEDKRPQHLSRYNCGTWTGLLAGLVRAGKAGELPEMLDRARASALFEGSSPGSRELEEKEALVAYDHMEDRIGSGSTSGVCCFIVLSRLLSSTGASKSF
mmetsp:Transcript_5947/g.13270  ORF Transcript_5947/g.13270 Transcript_5947/m.13270 type:complete len:189 (-) Transcript_5947:199-765(-)